jgi:glutathione S-transferase
MANIVTSTMQMDPNWGESRVGLRRRRTIVTGLRPLETDPPAYAGDTPNVAVITAVVAFDYLRLRFADAPWVEPTPRLEALAAAVADRPAFAGTKPFIPRS